MAKKKQWGEESIHASVKTPDPLQDEPENQKVLKVCHDRFGEVRLRINIGAYGPGTVEKPHSRFWWLLGESATVICKDPEICNWFREQLKEWVRGMDGIVLEVSDGHSE